MATVTTKLSITSTDLLSQSLNLSVNKSVTATHTTGLARAAVTSTAQGTASGQVTLYTASDFVAGSYLYVKNTDATATDYIFVYADDSADSTILRLGGGEFAIMPINAGVGFKAFTATSGTVVEFMIFGTEA
tara:strand:- start:353 stop:748 length:396 start_codon:yes stop_codon:yes gene_type:complete